MYSRQYQLMFAMLVVGLLSIGCSNEGDKKVSALENQNRDLSGQLTRSQSELENTRHEREELNRRLLAAQQEAEALRARLAQLPPEEPAPGWEAVPGGAMIAIDDSVLFPPGKAVLRDQAIKTLDQVAATIASQYSTKDILVFGHTDDRPIKKSGWDDNWQLSTERSLAVVRHLKERGIDPNRLVAAGCGEHRPRAQNDSEPNRTRNRRVEVFAIDPQTGTGRH